MNEEGQRGRRLSLLLSVCLLFGRTACACGAVLLVLLPPVPSWVLNAVCSLVLWCNVFVCLACWGASTTTTTTTPTRQQQVLKVNNYQMQEGGISAWEESAAGAL